MSLKIDKELLEKYHACENGKEILNLYPNGFTVDDVAAGKVLVPRSDVAWALTFLPLSPEEREKALKYAHIDDCDAFVWSHDIQGCSHIKHSAFCRDSDYVELSTDVYDSTDITSCTNIEASHHVSESESVFDSLWIMRSKDVDCSYGVFDSKDVTHSTVVYKSELVTSVLFGYQLKHCKNIGFCSQLTDTDNRLFCDSTAEGDFCILNKPVKEQVFRRTFDRIKDIVIEQPYPLFKDEHLNPYLLVAKSVIDLSWGLIKEALPPLNSDDKLFLYSLIPSERILNF